MSSLKSFIIEHAYLNVFVAVGPAPVGIAFLSLLHTSHCLHLSVSEGKIERGGFFSPPSAPFSGSPAYFASAIPYRILAMEKNFTLGSSFTIICLFFSFESWSRGFRMERG